MSGSDTQVAAQDEGKLAVTKDASFEVVRLTMLHRIISVAMLLFCSGRQTLFDSSPFLMLQLDSGLQSKTKDNVGPGGNTSSLSRIAPALVRWDSLHFLGIASPRPLPLPDPSLVDISQLVRSGGGGLYAEHSLAFQPAIVWLLRLCGYTWHTSERGANRVWDPSQAIVITSLLATVASLALPILFYRLSLSLTGRHRTARLAALLSILATSPATLVTPTPEPFFSFFALLGHLCLQHTPRNTFSTILFTASAALCFAVATAFRANGILLAGFIAWHIVWRAKPFAFPLFRLITAVLLSLVAAAPLLLTQLWAFERFCGKDSFPIRSWCDNRVPSVYSFVQSNYWHVGPFRYWTLAQLPNWILASPVLGLATSWLVKFYRSDPKQVLFATISPFQWRRTSLSAGSRAVRARGLQTEDKRLTARLTAELLDHAHYTLALVLTVIVTSHVQVILRFATPGALPVVWWSAADLIETSSVSKGRRRLWTGWVHSGVTALVLWNAISLTLYAGFYPPA